MWSCRIINHVLCAGNVVLFSPCRIGAQQWLNGCSVHCANHIDCNVMLTRCKEYRNWKRRKVNCPNYHFTKDLMDERDLSGLCWNYKIIATCSLQYSLDINVWLSGRAYSLLLYGATKKESMLILTKQLLTVTITKGVVMWFFCDSITKLCTYVCASLHCVEAGAGMYYEFIWPWITDGDDDHFAWWFLITLAF